MGTSFGLLKTAVLQWRRAASSLSISSKAAAGRARAGWFAWRGKGIIGTANGAPPESTQGSQSGAATRVGRRPGCEWARPPSATDHPLSLIWVSPDLPPKI